MPRYSYSALLLAVTGWIILFLPNAARADFYAHPWQDHHDSGPYPDAGVELSYLYTANNYESGGSSGTPAGLQSLWRFVIDVDLIYPVTPQFSLYGRLDWMTERLNSTSATGAGASTGGTGYGLGDQTLGANYRLLDSRQSTAPGAPRTTIDLQAQIDFPGYSDSTAEANSTPLLGDGSVDTTIGVFAGIPLTTFSTGAHLFLTGGIGYTYRSGGYSGDIPFWAGLLYSRSDTATDRGAGFYASLETTGFYSLSTDNNHLTTGAALDGGSYIVDAVNPTFVAIRGDIGYQTTGRLALVAYLEQSVLGQNAPVATIFGGGLRMTLGGPSSSESPTGEARENHSVDPVRQTDHAYGKGNQGFVTYNLEARVSRVNDRLNILKIDRGSQDGVEANQLFDIFSVKPNGQTGEAIARARVTTTKNEESALTITEYFREVLINEGFVAKRLVQ